MSTETAPGGLRPLDQANRLDCLYRQPVNRIHHCHLLSLLSPKADTVMTLQCFNAIGLATGTPSIAAGAAQLLYTTEN